MLSNLGEGGRADEHKVGDDHCGDGGGDSGARIAVWTGNARCTTAVQHHHQATAGHQQDHQRQERPESRPQGVVSRPEPGVLEQLSRLHDDALVLAGAWHRDHAVAEKQRSSNESRSDEDQHGRRHAVARLHTTTYNK